MWNLPTPLLALIGTSITFAATAFGAAFVFFFKRDVKQSVRSAILGFAAGIMIAASVWSLLIPAMDMAAEQGKNPWFSAAGGFALGGLFLFLMDHFLPHMHVITGKREGVHTNLKRTTLLVFAITLHNIPEGLAVGLAFAIAGSGGGSSAISISSALALAIGVALQNIPEGTAVSLPLREQGYTRRKAFLIGSLTGIVEPIAAVIGVLLIGSVTPLMPWFLSFAAGAMIYVVVEELIPESQITENSHTGTFGVMLGFAIMMILDVALA